MGKKEKHAFQMVVTRQSFLVTNTLFVSQRYPPTLIGYLHDIVCKMDYYAFYSGECT